MIQDSRGFLWQTSDEGLNRYDGRQFTVFKHDPTNPKSLNDNFINTVCEDLDGNIWVDTNNGISVFDPHPETFSRRQHDPKDPTSLSGKEINFLARDASGNIWVGTRCEGVSCYQ